MTFAFVNHLSRFYVLNMERKEAVELNDSDLARDTVNDLNNRTKAAAMQYWNQFSGKRSFEINQPKIGGK